MDSVMGNTSVRLRRLGLLGLLGWLTACSAATEGPGGTGAQMPRSATGVPLPAAASGGNSAAAGGKAPASNTAGAAAVGAAANSGVPAGGSAASGGGSSDACATGGLFQKEGCPCRSGETAACWTGPVADRNVGMCHDGLQVCSGGNSEFASWGPCMGEQLSCGTDAGVPPPPDEKCTCIPGAVIQCSEDCSVGIICSLTATKTCLPDGTWSTCREDVGVTLDLPGVQCRNMLHGCLDVLSPEGQQGQSELYVGDCSKHFKCGHAPTDPPPPPANMPEQPN